MVFVSEACSTWPFIFSLLATLLPLPVSLARSFVFALPSTPTELLQISQPYKHSVHSAEAELLHH